MASGKGVEVVTSPSTTSNSAGSSSEAVDRQIDQSNQDAGLTFARRGEEVGDAAGAVDGYDAQRMADRALLTAEEEKALMRRVDWRLMSICSLLFLMKNLDADNISNARIMNKGTDRNIMTELNMTSDQYNLLTVFYYVS
jgi:hypothetical protein